MAPPSLPLRQNRRTEPVTFRGRERRNRAKGMVRLSRFWRPSILGPFCRIEVGWGFEPAGAEYKSRIRKQQNGGVLEGRCSARGKTWVGEGRLPPPFLSSLEERKGGGRSCRLPPSLSSLEEREGGRRRRERERQNKAKGVVRLSRFGDPPILGTFCRIEVGQGFEPAGAEYKNRIRKQQNGGVLEGCCSARGKTWVGEGGFAASLPPSLL